jgi:hypothetical protein
MVVGHLAVALAAKKKAPTLSLGWLVAAVTTLDLIWPVFILTGVERVQIAPGATPFTPLIFVSYPWSHSLLMSVVWGGVLAGIALIARVPRAPALLLVPLVMSHWVLDLVTHVADLQLWPGSTLVFGLGLWRSIPGTIAVEGVMWLAAIAYYLRMRPLRGVGSHVAFWSLVLFITTIWITSPFTPPPPTIQALGWFALAGWLLVPWAIWADRRPTSS